MSERFPTTRHSVIEATRSADPEVRRGAFDTLVSAYWRPVYKYLRLRWKANPADGEDLTQGFFAYCMEKGTLERYDPGRARFRTFLRVCLDGYVANQRKRASRIKRGGAVLHVSLEYEDAEGELRRHQIPDDVDMEEYFNREWVRSLFAYGVEALRERCEAAGREVRFRLFERYDLEAPHAGERVTYADLAAEFGLTTTQVTNDLAAARRDFRRLVLDRLRRITGSEEEFRSEARERLGVDPL